MNNRCVLLYSGGLDSTLAAYLLKEQKIEIFPFKMVTPFCQCKESTRCMETINMIGNPLKHYFAKEDYINIILNPKYGYGSGMNPCIDCRIFLFRKAKEYMQEINASFIATGEVLKQRPMSQHKWQIELIERNAGVEGLVVRPLCGKLLAETLPEKYGIIDRNKLLSITGRTRKIQIELAKKYGIQDISTGCGCLLIDQNFIQRMKEFLQHYKNFTTEDIILLRYGRHFYFSKDGYTTKIIVGRDEQENKILQSYFVKGKHLLISPTFPGPTALCYLHENIDQDTIYNFAFEIIKKYSKKYNMPATTKL